MDSIQLLFRCKASLAVNTGVPALRGEGTPRGPEEGKQRGPSKPMVLLGRERGAGMSPKVQGMTRKNHAFSLLFPPRSARTVSKVLLAGGVAWLTSPVPSTELKFPPV